MEVECGEAWVMLQKQPRKSKYQAVADEEKVS